jgi:hypothetical protein
LISGIHSFLQIGPSFRIKLRHYTNLEGQIPVK